MKFVNSSVTFQIWISTTQNWILPQISTTPFIQYLISPNFDTTYPPPKSRQSIIDFTPNSRQPHLARYQQLISPPNFETIYSPPKLDKLRFHPKSRQSMISPQISTPPDHDNIDFTQISTIPNCSVLHDFTSNLSISPWPRLCTKFSTRYEKKQLYLDNQISSIHPKSQQPMEISTPNSQQFTFC